MKENRPRIWTLGLVFLLTAGMFTACDLQNKEKLAEEYLPTSLHATIQGMRTFYTAADGDENFIGDGYQAITGVNYDDIGCKFCHASDSDIQANDCAACHGSDDYSATVENDTCLGCHSRQSSEIALGFDDVHSTTTCEGCHAWEEMHGDGTAYQSMWAEGARYTTCEGCHTGENATGPAVAANHDPHGGKLHCSACHVESVITCYNCHFDSEVSGAGKVASAKFGGSGDKAWVMLLNHDGQVRTGSFQSLVYEGGNTFVVFAPFHGHSVSATARTCGDCHGNDAITQLSENGKIVFSTFDEATGKPVQQTFGAIPLVDGKIELTFMDLDNSTGTPAWTLIEQRIPENIQYGYCTPLTDEQVAKMGPLGGS